MRYYPPVTTFVTRTANEDYHYGDVTIPKNSTVRIPTHQLHHSEELWPNHEVFDPERFRDKANIDPVAFQPFGTGEYILDESSLNDDFQHASFVFV